MREHKWVVRDFEYDPMMFSHQNANREQSQIVLAANKDKLERSCKILFSELFIALMHLKAMRVFCESILRFSLPPRFFSVCIKPKAEKTKKILDSLVKKFLTLGDNASMYGPREENEDGEDFFPFVFLRISLF